MQQPGKDSKTAKKSDFKDSQLAKALDYIKSELAKQATEKSVAKKEKKDDTSE